MALRYHAGGIIDVAIVRSKSRDGNKIKIFGDELPQTADNFVPPTKHRKAQFLKGLEMLAAPVAGYLPADSRIPTYPETPSECIPGRPDVKVKLYSTNRSSRYVWLNVDVTNQSQSTIKWFSYQWARDTFVPKLEEQFAYQSGTRFMVYTIQACDFRYLYPGCAERISVCVGPELGQGEIRVFIPAYYFGGLKDAYFMLAATAPPPLAY